VSERYFDLNIERILEGWGTRHAVRELIANALDEQILSGTQNIEIFQDRDSWHVRDYGRGLRYDHLTQNENAEKLENASRVIGKFGVGLKDALATLNRHHIDVRIRSKYGDIALAAAPKHGFSDVITLHATVLPPVDPSCVGTDIAIYGIGAEDIQAAKEFFLRFSGEKALDETLYGQILERLPGRPARIYVTGLLVAEEEKFAFSYNITSLTAAMRRALNRERTNVGRTAYTDRVKAMLLSSTSSAVVSVLAADLAAMEHGTEHDEVRWSDVAAHACQILNSQEKVVFVTASELSTSRDTIDFAISEGCHVVTIPDNVRRTVSGLTDANGQPVRDMAVLRQEWSKGFEFSFVRVEDLSCSERDVFEKWKHIAQLGGGLPANVIEIKISETMRPDAINGDNTIGLWEPGHGRIILKRCQLSSTASFAGTLLHEITHARSGYSDVSRDFEGALTETLGTVAAAKTDSRPEPQAVSPAERPETNSGKRNEEGPSRSRGSFFRSFLGRGPNEPPPQR
jgi:hypothetical protein